MQASNLLTKVLYSQYSRTFNFLITRLLSNLFLLLNRCKILLCTNFKKMYSLYGYNLVQNLQQSRASMIISFNSSAAKWQMHFNLITLKIVMDQVPKFDLPIPTNKYLNNPFIHFWPYIWLFSKVQCLKSYLLLFEENFGKLKNVLDMLIVSNLEDDIFRF